MVHPLKFLANLFNKKSPVHADDKTKDQQSAPPHRVVPAMPCTFPNIYSDAVHFRLDGLLPYKTPHHEVLGLLKNFRQKLTSNAYKPGEKVPTQFPGVKRVSENHYEVTLANKQTETCTLAEAELHMLLVENQRYRESSRNSAQGNTQAAASAGTQKRSSPRHPGSSASKNSSGTPAAPLGSAQAADGAGRAPASPPKTPDVQNSSASASSSPSGISITDGVVEYTDHLNNPLRILNSQGVDITTFDARIKQSHHLKEISGATNGCWWRTAILSAILQHSPEALQEIIVRKLGSQFQNEAEALAKMARAVRELGPNAILTNTPPTKSLPENLRSPSSLKSPDMDDDSGKEIGEGICRIIAAALLERAGCSESERIRLFANAGMGSTEHIAAILRELDSDTVLFTNPWNALSSTGPVTHDTAAANITVCAGRERGVRDITNDPSVAQCTENLLQHTATTPILIHQGAHFNLAIPKEWFPVSPAHRN